MRYPHRNPHRNGHQQAFRENVCVEDIDFRDTNFWVDSEDLHMDDISQGNFVE